MTLVSLSMFAQNEHLKFKGIPIDGTLKDFTTKLIAKGYVLTSVDDNITSLKGSFAGYNDCSILVYGLDNTDLVYTVAVMFPYYKSWPLLEGNYNNIKSMLTTKYGEPVLCHEEFQRSTPPRDDMSKYNELMLGRCDYSATFKTDNGLIILKLCNEDLKCYVLLGYLDDINSSLGKAAAIDDL